MKVERGKDLDTLVEKHIMRRPLSSLHQWIWGFIGGPRLGREGYSCSICGAPEGSAEVCVPSYSQDIRASWMVVERMYYFSENNADKKFEQWWQTHALWAMSHLEASEALCLAALTCVGIDVDMTFIDQEYRISMSAEEIE